MISIKRKMVVGLFAGLMGLSQVSQAHNDAAYNHDYSAVANNPDWMARADGSKKVSELSLPGTHDTMSIKSGDIWQNQTMTLMQQLNSGVRVFDMRTRHINDTFRMHHGMIAQDTYFDDVLRDIDNFLTAHPSETVLFRLRSEHTSENNTRSYTSTLDSYLAANGSKHWVPTNSNPTLDEIRGKFVILQEFSGGNYGLSYGYIDKQDDYSMSTNWDLYDKWTSIKNHLNKSKNGNRDTIYMNYITASGGSFPYFVSSGHSSNGTSAPRLATGLTTPGWNSSYPDFPRVSCFIGICTIAFEGMNVLTADYIANGGFAGMVMADFPGKRLIDNIINLNDLADPFTGSISGSWSNSGGRDRNAAGNPTYILTVAEGTNVTIDLKSNVDTYLYVEEITTGWQSENDDGGDGYNSRLSFNTYSGTGVDHYRLTAATYSGGQSGNFTLTASTGISLEPEYRELRDGRSGKCLDFEGSSPANGKKAVLWDCANVAWQKWKYDVTTGLLRNKANPDYCLDNVGQRYNGGSVHMWQCYEGSVNQTWDFVGNSLRPRANNNIALDAFGTGNGSTIGQWSHHGGTNQQWNWGN